MPKRKQGEVDNEGVQDFELIELLIRETGGVSQPGPSTSTRQRSGFESFKARFQSYVDQVPSYLHSVGKEGFFPHFFLGSFSTLINTEIAKKLKIKKIYFRFDTSGTLKVAVISNDKIQSYADVKKHVKLISISEHHSNDQNCKFTSGDLVEILKKCLTPPKGKSIQAEAQGIKDAFKGPIDSVLEMDFRLIQISRNNINKEGINVEVIDTRVLNSAVSKGFHEVKGGLWSNPESDIAKLTNPDVKRVKEPVQNILKKVSEIHSGYRDSLVYADQAREAAHHGFIAGALVNFRYRHNLRVYLEQFAGRGYADIVLVPRGKDRSLNAVPIIIELKAGTGRDTTPNDALEQAKGYAKGFQPNTMRVLTISDNVLCVGLNLDSIESEKFSMHISPREDREIAPPTMQALLKEASDWNGRQDTITNVKEKIKQPLERIYHTFPGTPEKGGNYFSRFLLGQLLLADKFVDIDLEKSVFLYNEYPLASSTRSGAQSTERPVTTFMLTKGNQGQDKEVFIFHIREGGKGEFSEKKIPINLPKVGKITEVCISLQEERKSDFFDIKKIDRYNSLNEYKGGKESFNGEWKNIPYPAELKEKFDAVLESQLASSQDRSQSIGKYKELFGKLGEAVLPFKVLIEREAHTQAVFHGAFSHYSDMKLGELQENRALVLTEFQTGRGKRIDMVVHGIKFAGQASSAKEYDPVGLELKGPREGKTADALVKEANDQINTEYVKGVTYKTLTDGTEVAFMGVVFDKGANNADSLILMSKDEFASVKVVHSSIFSFSQQQCSKGRKQRSTGMVCIDSRDEEKITEKEKEKLIKELFGIEAYDTKIITIDSPQVSIDSGKVNIKFKDNNGNDKELIIDNATNIKSIKNYVLDKENLEVKLKVSNDKEYTIVKEVKEQGTEYYISIEGYKIKLDSVVKDFTTDIEKDTIFNRLHQLSNDKELLENKKYIEDVGSIEIANQNYDNVISEIKRNLLEKGVRENTFNQFENHFSDINKKVFAKYIDDVRKNLEQRGIEFDHNKFDSAKIKGAKSGKFFSLMAIYDLFDSISDATTLGRHDNDALKQVFGINGILDAMDDVRESISISHNSKIGKLVSKIPQPIRQAFIKVISNPVVQGITFATIAYQFGYSVDEITKGNHHPLNYYWAASSGVKLASMSIKPISIGISSTMKGVSATTKILRGLSAASKVLSKVAAVTMVADIFITIGIEIHERVEYTKAIAEQIPLLPGNEQAEVFFAKVVRFFTGRDVEKEYGDIIRVKGYLNHVKEVAIKLLDENYNIAAIVQYVISIEEKYSEIIRDGGRICQTGQAFTGFCPQTCELEEKYNNISFSNVNTASNAEKDLSLLNISKALEMRPYTLVMSEGWERFICNIKNNPKCDQDIDKKKVYVVNTDAKHIPHLTKYEHENLGLRIVDAPLGKPIQKSQCGKIINEENKDGDIHRSCNTGKIHRNCQETFTLSGKPFIFTNPKRKDSSLIKKGTYPKDAVLYISGPRTLTAAANYPAVMHIPEGSDIRYIGSKNNETIFIINDHTSGTLEGGAGKENTLVMNVKANNVVVDLHEGAIHYGSNNIKLVNTYNYVSNSDSKQNILTHCRTRLINAKNAEVQQNLFNCTDKDYEVRVVNKENVHYRGLKQTIFIVNDNSDNAKIVSDLSDAGKENFDVIDVQGANITQLEISEDIGKGSYSLNLLADDMESIVSSTKIDDFKNLVIQAEYQGITESVVIQDKSLSDIVKDIWYQELNGLGKDIDGEVVQNGEKKLKAFIQANILNLELPNAYQITKDIANNNNLNIPVSKIEVTKNYMGIPAEKVIIGGVYSDQIIVDFSYNNSDFASSYQRYHDNRGKYDYNRYMIECNHYQDIIVEGGKGQYQYIIKLPEYNHTLEYDPLSSPIRLNLKIKNRTVLHQSIPYDIIDFAELNVMDINSINIREGERNYINECYNKPISDLTEDSLEIQNITILDSKGIRWSLSIGLIDYLKSPEHQYIILRINNKFYKIDSANLELKHIETNPNFFRYYKPDEQGLQIYHNQPINNNDIGLVDFRDKSILGFDAEVINDSLVLLHKNNTLIKVENWNTYQPAREMIFAFNDTILSNSKCIISTCNSEDIIGDLNKEKVVVLKNQMFNAIVQNNISEAEDLIRRIGNIDTENKHELTPLYVAIQEGRLDVVKLLFNRGSVNVKDKDIHGCNSLHWAAQEGKLNIAKLLVDKGANITAEDNNGRTPLRLAAYSGNLDMVKFFLNKSVDIESESNDPDKMMGKIESVRKKIINQVDASPNVKKWAKSFIEELRYSIKSKAKRKLDGNISSNCSASTTELTNRIYNFNKNLFDNIIKEVVDDAYGRIDTKKILSCVRSHGYIDQLISGYIAVFDAMQKSGDLNDSAIFKLAYYIKEAMEMENYPNVPLEKRSSLEKLENRLPKSVRNAIFASKVCIKNVYQDEYLYAANKCFNYDNDRRMAFTWTPKNEKNDKFRWEIKPNGDNFYIVNVAFNETLYAASNYFNYDNDRRMVFTWISEGGVARDVWKLEPDGDNCSIMNVKLNEYLYAASYAKYDNDRRRVLTWIPGGQVSQGMWMIEDCGSNVRKVRDIVSNAKGELDQELLDAAKVGDMSKVKDSVNRGADVNTKDRDGNTPLRNAVLKGHFGIFKYLVENGVSLEGKDHRCGPSICDASYSGNLDILKYLIGKGVDINESNNDGWTPLHFAAWRGYLEVANFLIEKGANINVKNIFGRKPIHIAAENNNKNIIEFFLSKGMSIDDTDRDGRTPLYYASWNGHLDAVKYLVEKGADVYTQDKGGKTLLDAATDQKHDDVERYLKQVQLDRELLIVVQYGNLNEVKDLVSQGASINAKDKNGKTSMDIAIDKKHDNIVKYLQQTQLDRKLLTATENGDLSKVREFVSQGANVNAKDKDGKIPIDIAIGQKHDDIVKYLQQTQSDLNKQLLIAVLLDNNLNKVKDLVSRGASMSTRGDNGYTPLHSVVSQGYLEVAKFLIEQGADINAKDYNGYTPLHLVASQGYLEAVELLIERGADINTRDYNGYTPLRLASSSGYLDVIKYLTGKGADIDAKDDNGYTPLRLVVSQGNLKVTKFLIEQRANINVKDKEGKTPMDIAIDQKYDDIVKYLQQTQLDLNKQLLTAVQDNNLNKVKDLVSRGADVNMQYGNGWTPLYLAVLKGYLDVIKYLTDKGADINVDVFRRKLIHIATANNHKDIIEFLLSKGVSVNDTDGSGQTPLHYAASQGNLEVTKFLIEQGADINAKDNGSKTPMDIAIDRKHDNIVRYLQQTQLDLNKQLLTAVQDNNLNKVKDLVSRGADVNMQYGNGWAPLHLAALEGCFVIVKYLIENNANIDAKNNIGRTSLHNAARNGHLDVVKYLIEKGADFEIKDKDDKTPLDLASWKEHNDVVKYLEEIKEEREKPVQRKRRHHHGDYNRHHNHLSSKLIDSSNQPEIAASSGTRPSSWINGLFGWVKGSVGGFRAALSEEASNTASSIPQVDEQFAKASVSSSSSTSTTLPSDGTDKKQENGGFFRDNIDYVNANIKQMRERQTPVKFKPSSGNIILEMGDHYLSQVDFNGTIMLLDLLIRKVTGQKYISTVDQSISPLEAQGYTLNITKGFEKVVEQAGLKSGISMHRLNIDYMGMQKEIIRKVMSGKFNEISGILKSYVEKACPGEEAGKLSPKKFDKFIAQFNKGLLNQSIEQILHNRDGRLEVDGAKQMSLEPQSYLSNASVHSHSEVSTCLSEIGVTKLGGNINR
ncbi:ankyrin repeat domain-containing protein [Wolbachia endosymbiont of Phyllotreta cruciferae]|uniref:ankyrin repeat domain-containing protein n=1 Tax=Wolbachia endosymbiont of Phyllotreta cruciferae TaxID=2886377 RepID=UPI0020A1F81A|nr:ankyrin repeat domain-containing protein [Wolbachia endosymbiont of Phyllotreta cruciferae]